MVSSCMATLGAFGFQEVPVLLAITFWKMEQSILFFSLGTKMAPSFFHVSFFGVKPSSFLVFLVSSVLFLKVMPFISSKKATVSASVSL
ncbi:hypothetical protein D9M72_652240 [compost metagenome]